jgi:hypothetical protein
MTTSKVVIKTMRTNVILRDLDEFEDYKDLNILCDVILYICIFQSTQMILHSSFRISL